MGQFAFDPRFPRAYPSLKKHILFHSNGLAAVWLILSDIRHIKVNYDQWSAILNLIEFIFFREYPYLKPHILFYSRPDGPAIWHGLSGIKHIKGNYGR